MNKEDSSIENYLKVLIKCCLWTTFAIPLTIFDIIQRFFPQRKSLEGKLVLLNSSGGDLNRNLALVLADHGCDIAIVDLNDDFSTKLAKEVNEKKKTLAKTYKFDTSNSHDITRLQAAVKSDFGHVDILINNSEFIDTDNIDKMIRTNVLGTIMLIREFYENMKSSTSGGHIVTLTSISGLLPSPTAITYSSTKASIISYMIGLTEKIRHEDFEQKIKTTCICLPSTKVERNYLKDETTLNVINAIIREENFITIPNYYGILIRLLSVLPLSTQQLARELFLKENF